MGKRKLSMKRKESIYGYIFILPFIVGFFAFTAGPLLFSLAGSFTDYNITSQMNFNGVENYQSLIMEDGLFRTSLWNTIYYVAFSVPLTTIGAIFISSLLNQKVPGIRYFRTLYYLPAVLSGVGVYLLWMQLLEPGTGMVNLILGWVGIDGPNWLYDPDWTKPSLILMKLWSVGGSMLLYLASMQGVSKNLYEAAEIDGASRLRQFFLITIPHDYSRHIFRCGHQHDWRLPDFPGSLHHVRKWRRRTCQFLIVLQPLYVESGLRKFQHGLCHGNVLDFVCYRLCVDNHQPEAGSSLGTLRRGGEING